MNNWRIRSNQDLVKWNVRVSPKQYFNIPQRNNKEKLSKRGGPRGDWGKTMLRREATVNQGQGNVSPLSFSLEIWNQVLKKKSQVSLIWPRPNVKLSRDELNSNLSLTKQVKARPLGQTSNLIRIQIDQHDLSVCFRRKNSVKSKVELNDYHELNSLSLVCLMWSLTFNEGLRAYLTCKFDLHQSPYQFHRKSAQLITSVYTGRPNGMTRRRQV